MLSRKAVLRLQDIIEDAEFSTLRGSKYHWRVRLPNWH